MSTAPCCQGGLRAFISRKLGRCSRCMRASALATLGGWATFGVTYVIWPHPALLGLSLIIAASFTLLLLAHLVVLTARVVTLHAGHSAAAHAGFRVGRRVVLLRFGPAALWAAAFGFGLFRMQREAAAGPVVTCSTAKLDTRGVAGSNLGTKQVCAKNRHVAEEAARPLFQAAAAAFASMRCQPFSTNVCPFCVGDHETIDVDCNEISGTCPNRGDKLFSCAATVTRVTCRCGTT
jgi:hypothetical protein